MASYECRGKNKLWSVRFNITDPTGKEITKRLSGFERKKDAESAYRKFMDSYTPIKVSSNLKTIDRPLKDFLPEYIAYKKSKLKESSLLEIKSIVYKYIIPVFGECKIKDITKIKILEWQNSLQHFSFNYKRKIRTNLHALFKYLYFYYDIDNVVDRVEGFNKPIEKKEMQFWTLDEFNQFISCIDNKIWQVFFSFLYYTGCRLGEILALNINDINIGNRMLNITKSISTKYIERHEHSYIITTPKNTSSIRKIYLPVKLINLFNEYIERYPELKTQQFLFFGNKPLTDSTLHRKLDEYCLKSKVKKIRIHDFRHSHASLLIANGANVVLVAKRLGHSNTQQTLNTYTHLFPSSEFELIEKFDQILE